MANKNSARDDRPYIPEYMVEGARIIFRNFQGKKSDYNDEGNRNFTLCVPEEDVESLREYGWNVKRLKPRDDDENREGQAILKVKVNYESKRPPIAVLITSRGKTTLREDTIGQLDWARIKNVDLTVRPYIYPATPLRPSGVSAYLKCIYVTIEEDPLELKYASIPSSDDDYDDEEKPFE